MFSSSFLQDLGTVSKFFFLFLQLLPSPLSLLVVCNLFRIALCLGLSGCLACGSSDLEFISSIGKTSLKLLPHERTPLCFLLCLSPPPYAPPSPPSPCPISCDQCPDGSGFPFVLPCIQLIALLEVFWPPNN